MKAGKNNIPIIIVVFTAVFFIPFLGSVHLFDWDEINFAECAREMIVTGNYFNPQMNFMPFWEKPPLFIWMQALSMKAFGVNEFAARFPNAVCGIITLLLVFRIGKRIADEKMGLLWAASYAASLLPQFYFRSGIIDPWFNLFIFSSVYYLVKYSFDDDFIARKRNLKWLVYAGVLAGLAVLTKGPAALIILSLCAGTFFIVSRFKFRMPPFHLLALLCVVIITGGLWFILLYMKGQDDVVRNFISYQVHLFNTEDSGHGGPFYYHFVVLLLGCFPASAFALYGLKNRSENNREKHFHRWMLILFWVVLILFSIVQTKIVHYSSLCYFPLTWFSAVALHKIWNGEVAWKKWINVLLLCTGGLIALALTIIAFFDHFKDRLINSGLINDQMAVENLKADVHWNGFEWLAGFTGLAAIIFCIVMVGRKKIRPAITILLTGSFLMTFLASLLIVPRIEGYTQAAVIDFHKSLQGKNVYVEALNYWSYAQYFYTQKKVPANKENNNMEWLLHGDIDRDVYFVSKVTLDEMNKKEYSMAQEIGRKNGFVFYKRAAQRDTSGLK